MIRFDRSHQLLAVGVAILAGFVDAIGFVESGGFFVSFMTGNSTRLAVGVAEADAVGAVAVGVDEAGDGPQRTRGACGAVGGADRRDPPVLNLDDGVVDHPLGRYGVGDVQGEGCHAANLAADARPPPVVNTASCSLSAGRVRLRACRCTRAQCRGRRR